VRRFNNMSKIDKIFYWDLTFPEVREIVAEERVPLLPVGQIEQHGPHLPLKVDCVAPGEVCRLAADLVKYDAIVMPPVYYSYGSHHTNFPGTIDITEQNLIGYVSDILFSLAQHGFKKMIVVDGHGGNPPYLNAAMRRLNVRTFPNPAAACIISWTHLIPQEALNSISDSEYGGMGHAGELETSVVLHTDSELVQMDKAVKELWNGDIRQPPEAGSAGGTPVGPAMYVGWMGAMGGDKYGIMGDPTVATAEKGRQWLNIAVENLAKFIPEWKNMPINPIVDHH
jgi:creatinine amidohydrolase